MTVAPERIARTTSSPAPVGVLLAAGVLAVLVAAALVPGLLSPADPLQAEVTESLQPPSAEHPFGTDQAGRDILSRVVHGARYSLLVGVGATGLALLAGLVIGVASGLAPRSVDGVLARVIEVIMAFPEFLLALLVVAIIGPGEASVIAAVALAATPAYARVARIRTLVVKRSGYVRATVALGVPQWRIVLRHILPNTLGPLLVMATIGLGTAIVSAAGLSFLGLGPQPPTPEWGLILSDGRNFLGSAWWIAVFPGLAITVTVIASSVVGRHLQARNSGRRS